MRLASLLPVSDPDDDRPRRNFAALLLTILAHILLLFMLLRLTPYAPKLPGVVSNLVTFNVLPEAKTDTQKPKTATSAAAAHKTNAPAAPSRTAPEPKIKITAAMPWVLTPGLEKFDIKQVPVTKPAEDTPAPSTAEADSEYTGGSGKAVYGPSMDGGTGGGGGERLYYAEWYRPPTDAELSFYLPKDRNVTGWGEVACQTIERYHVDNCRELGESPAGTGLSRVVRQAAWQFLVRPPHVGGKSLIGAWVRIRITYTESGARYLRH